MTLLLADVCDWDCLASAAPLALDVPTTERYVRGAQAIAQRVLAEWVDRVGLLELEGQSFDRGALVTLRSALEQVAEEEEYVLSADAALTLDDASKLQIACTLRFAEGSYRFSVSTADAVSVNFEAAA